MKLQYKLFLFFAGVVLLPLMVATVAASLMLGRSGEDLYESRIRSGLAASTAIMSNQARELSTDLETMIQPADVEVLLSGEPARITATLESLLQRSGSVSAVLADGNGGIVAESGENVTGSPPMLEARVELEDPGGRQWNVTFYRPLQTEAIADVFTNLGLEWSLLANGSPRQGSLPPDAVITAEKGLPLETPISSESPEDFRITEVDGEAMFSSLVAVPPDAMSNDAILFAGVDEHMVGAASRRVLIAGMAVMLGVGALAAFLGYYLTRTMTSPLRELTSAARAGIEGNLDKRVELSSNDELGSLATSFNLMQESIGRHITQIEESRRQLLMALSYAGEILESTTDREKLVEITAQAARLAAGVDGVMVELFEKGGMSGHDGVVRCFPETLCDSDVGERARELSGSVAAGVSLSGETVRLDDSIGLVSFPLIHDRRALGTLIAAYRLERPIDDNGRKILGSLALQAASALENVNYGELQHSLAITDQMTGLYNYRYLEEFLVRELNRSRRYGHYMTVAIADLDDFKLVNDSFGHAAGDALLQAVAESLRENVRDADVVARYGGEEFVIVFPETRKTASQRVLEKLRHEVAMVRLAEYPEIETTISIGVAGYPMDAEEPENLLKRADDALYRSKLAGKNRVSAA